ncbi:hypothetical protein BD324DRAFT_636109 [Kockovaella imperatae]|uniref:Glutathione S-transferase n=1 Tax=Kockovaella imperatae TaxID=4999 RepID=A0A1Y1UAB2_9TREE|nr:hypothetical protein BD324DRAFT_636109 [Kockovaella imperatae]ORX34484.1 hypothetical protein BD324DRAFT_636109 [Kockovaella imperatae]
MASQITLHHLNASRSTRIFWVLEELGQPYDVRVHFRGPTRQAPQTLKDVTPFGKAPAVELDGELLVESGYIIDRILDLFPPGSDVESVPSNNSKFWSHYCEGSLVNYFQMSATLQITSAGWTSGAIGDLDEAGKAGVKKYANFLNETLIRGEITKNLGQMEKFLAEHPGKYLSGTDKPGSGDFQVFFPIYSLLEGTRKGVYEIGPATQAWWKMVMARPAAKRALERQNEEEERAKAKI